MPGGQAEIELTIDEASDFFDRKESIPAYHLLKDAERIFHFGITAHAGLRQDTAHRVG